MSKWRRPNLKWNYRQANLLYILYIYFNVLKRMTDVKLLLVHRNTWNHLTVCKQMSSGSFENIINKMCLQIIYLAYMYKEDLALNIPQGLICHQPNKQTKYK